MRNGRFTLNAKRTVHRIQLYIHSNGALESIAHSKFRSDYEQINGTVFFGTSTSRSGTHSMVSRSPQHMDAANRHSNLRSKATVCARKSYCLFKKHDVGRRKRETVELRFENVEQRLSTDHSELQLFSEKLRCLESDLPASCTSQPHSQCYSYNTMHMHPTPVSLALHIFKHHIILDSECWQPASPNHYPLLFSLSFP